VPSNTRRDPSLIDSAPPETGVGSERASDDVYFHMVTSLASELDAANAELSRLKAKRTIEEVRAGMLEEYSNKVFWFVVFYCLVVGIMLVLAGWNDRTGFSLSDTILGIIAGSTAVSVIGLIGMVISGLFGGAASQRAKTETDGS